MNRVIMIALAGAAALCGPGLHPAYAQAPAPVRQVGLDAAVAQAVAQNPVLASAQTTIARAEALLQQSRAALMPTVSGAITSVTYDSARGFEDATTQPRSQVLFSATAAVPLFAPEARARVTQGRDNVEVAALSAAAARQQVAVATAQAYIGIVTAHRQVEVSERSLETARAHLDYAERRLEGGAGSRLNQLRAAQAVAVDEAALESSYYALLAAQEALGLLMAEEGPVDVTDASVFDEPVTDIGDDWLAERPDVQYQARAVEAADRVVRDSWKAWLPTAGLSFTPQAVAPGSLFSPSRTWQLGISLSQRIFDRAPAAEKALRQVTLSQTRFARDEVELRARSEVRLARQAVTRRERVLETTVRAAEQAAEVLRISTAAFELGATTNLEVIDAQRSARDADTAVSLAESALRSARLDLLVALGRFK